MEINKLNYPGVHQAILYDQYKHRDNLEEVLDDVFEISGRFGADIAQVENEIQMIGLGTPAFYGFWEGDRVKATKNNPYLRRLDEILNDAEVL